MKIQCKTCKHIKSIPLNPGEKPIVPRRCTSGPTNKPCEMDSFVILPTGDVIDEQRLKIQENPEDIPTGEIPRTTALVSNRYNVDKCVPGDRVRVTGIMMVQDSKAQNLGYGYIYVTGIEKVKERVSVQYTQQE
jgi:DNA replication licensing factor MCM5